MLSSLILAGFLVGALSIPTVPTLNINQEIMDKFMVLDKNSDGIYSKAEAWANILTLDKDGDNLISKEEFYAHWSDWDRNVTKLLKVDTFDKFDYDKNGVISQTDVNTEYALMDLDSNGEVSFTEYFQYVKAESSILSSTHLVSWSVIEASFALIDTNNDKNMSFDEFWAYAKHIDTNDDDRVSKVEFMNALANITLGTEKWPEIRIFELVDSNGDQFLDKAEMVVFYKLHDQDGDGIASQGEMTALLDTLSRMAQVLSGIKTTPTFADYGFKDADKNHDGKLTFIEEWDNILRLDNNTDHKISLAEFMTLFEFNDDEMKKAAQKVFRKYDTDNSGFFEMFEIVPFFKEMDADGDGSVAENTYATFIEVIFSKAGANITAAFIAQTHETQADFVFSVADTNHDGLLSVDELWASALLLDKDGDGRLNTTEYLARYWTFPPNIQAAGPKIFDRFDYDNNGYLEKTDVIKGYPQVDASGDGFISLLEYVQFVLKLYTSFGIDVNLKATNTPPNLSDYGFSAMDTNHDGQVTFEEQWAAIIILDTNGDNRVSQPEYVKSLPPQVASIGEKIFQKFDSDSNGFFEKVDIRRFSALVDTNGDGTVSSDEYTSFVGTLLTSLGIDLSAFTTPRPTPAS